LHRKALWKNEKNERHQTGGFKQTVKQGMAIIMGKDDAKPMARRGRVSEFALDR
jgi:hypothetical protein